MQAVNPFQTLDSFSRPDLVRHFCASVVVLLSEEADHMSKLVIYGRGRSPTVFDAFCLVLPDC